MAANMQRSRAQRTIGKKTTAISDKKQHVINQLSALGSMEKINPKFSLTCDQVSSDNIVNINGANIGYDKDNFLLVDINLAIIGNDRVAICGPNACGKSTLLKAILGDKHIIKSGNWHTPKMQYIGYLDQHYSNLGTSQN